MRANWIGTCCSLAVLIAAPGCGDDAPTDVPDAGDGDAGESGPTGEAGMGGNAGAAGDVCTQAAASVMDSLERWRALSASEGATYWYDEENCAPNMLTGTVNTVQVDPSGPTLVRSRAIPPEDCEVQVNRYETLRPSSFEDLYGRCDTLVMRECDATFTTDDRGIVRGCTWDKDDLCDDNCGEGFHIRQWGFGVAPQE